MLSVCTKGLRVYMYVRIHTVPSTNIGTFGKYEQEAAVKINLHF